MRAAAPCPEGSRHPQEHPLHLTPREQEVLCYVARGWNNAQIARALGVRVGTVRTHLQNMFAKFEVPNRTALVAAALQTGWLASPTPLSPVAHTIAQLLAFAPEALHELRAAGVISEAPPPPSTGGGPLRA